VQSILVRALGHAVFRVIVGIEALLMHRTRSGAGRLQRMRGDACFVVQP